MRHNDQCQCTECVASRQEQPAAPVAYEGSGGVRVEVVEHDLSRLADIPIGTKAVIVRTLMNPPAIVVGCPIVGAAVLDMPGHTVALLVRRNGQTLAIWYDRETGQLMARDAVTG